MKARPINQTVLRAALDAYRSNAIDRTSALNALSQAGVAPSAAEALLRATPVMVEPARNFTPPPRLMP